jgi:3',5'-cyclic AMP phosphodiesterase CpdA
VPGNHEYGTPGAAGFFSYFGDRAGTSGLGYFSFDLGAWHIIALNSNCAAVPCGPGSAQHNWLQADLAAHRNACTLAFFHHPLFGSGQGVNEQPIRPFWDTLYAAGADLVLNGHSHNYERFAPQSPAGAAEPARGIRQITVGTGGDDLQPFLPGVAANSQSRSSTSFGVLTLTLQPSGYSWRFRPAAGGTFTDSGTGSCH